MAKKQLHLLKYGLRIVKYILLLFIIFILIQLIRPTWTPNIKGENSISELRKVEINGENLQILIRGEDKNNPVVIFVHGGPGCSEIPYVRKYQDLLEKDFTIVHYDQRGSGKSYQFGHDYADVTAGTHVDDLIEITRYVKEYLKQDQVILIGHSYGTYIATLAASQAPEEYVAYVGIGQMSNTIESELDTLYRCMEQAKITKNNENYSELQSLEEQIKKGERIVPRQYVRKYGMAARLIDENWDYLKGFLFGKEYNLLDTIRYSTAILKYQDQLIKEALDNPITELVTTLDLPVYFVMGVYDGMTSPKVAESYLYSLKGSGEKIMVLFEQSAHYPQFEEKDKFYEWMKDTFLYNK